MSSFSFYVESFSPKNKIIPLQIQRNLNHITFTVKNLKQTHQNPVTEFLFSKVHHHNNESSKRNKLRGIPYSFVRLGNTVQGDKLRKSFG